MNNLYICPYIHLTNYPSIYPSDNSPVPPSLVPQSPLFSLVVSVQYVPFSEQDELETCGHRNTQLSQPLQYPVPLHQHKLTLNNCILHDEIYVQPRYNRLVKHHIDLLSLSLYFNLFFL